MSWVLRHSEAKLGARLVLLVLADHASDDGTGAWPSVGTIAREARMSESQTRDCLRRLEGDGAIKANGKSSRGTVIYDVLMVGGPESGGGRSSAPNRPSTTTTDLDLDLDGGVQGGVTAAAANLPKRVDYTTVSEDDGNLALGVLAAWNRLAGQSLRSKEWLAMIVKRVREYPELGLIEHEHIIESSLANPWWSRAPTPSVIYGNGAQFERCLADASHSAVDDLQTTFELVLAAINERRAT